MREVYFNSDITPKSMGEIKLLALYYDKIIIINDAVYSPKFTQRNGEYSFSGTEELEFIPREFRYENQLLLSEGIIEVTKREENPNDPYEQLLAEKISEVVNSSEDYIFPIHPHKPSGKIITEEVYDIMKYMLGYKWGQPIEKNYLWWYYSLKLKWFLKLLIDGRNCITSSNNLQYLFSSFINGQMLKEIGDIDGHSKTLAFDALKLRLPNPEMLTIEEILELKEKLKDELALFSLTINEIETRNKNLFNAYIDKKEYQAMFFSEIQKPLRDLEIAMKNLRSKTFRHFVDKIRDYRTFVPLMGTVFSGLPVHYAIMAGLGMAAGQSYLEFSEQHRELKNNGLYYLLKIK